MSSVIEVNDISKTFGSITAVDHLTFSVPEGEIFGFLGPNGSGKSTTLRMLLSLIKPTSGEIKLFGKKLATNRSNIMREIGCIIEKPDFYKYLTAHENLKICARAYQLDVSQDEYKKLYALVELDGRENDKVSTYSHGMKQRLGLAQALLHNPKLIILDEPNTGLDPRGIIELRELIIKLNREQGKTIVFSSHILSEVEEICHSLVVINKGKKVASGQVSALLSEEDLLVDVEVVQVEVCQQLIQQSRWSKFLKQQNGNIFRFNIPLGQVSELNKYLIDQNIDLISSNYRKRLEDYFLRITEQR